MGKTGAQVSDQEVSLHGTAPCKICPSRAGDFLSVIAY